MSRVYQGGTLTKKKLERELAKRGFVLTSFVPAAEQPSHEPPKERFVSGFAAQSADWEKIGGAPPMSGFVSLSGGTPEDLLRQVDSWVSDRRRRT